MILELSRLVSLDRIGSLGLDFTVEATAAECAALTERMQISAVLSLTCTFHLVRESRDTVFAKGTLRAAVTQNCVVSLEDFDAAIEEVFQIRFVPEGEESDDEDFESDDEVTFEGNVIDLGEAAAQQLALALDPYPRAPGVELPDVGDEPDEKPNPFAALRRLN